MDKNLLQEQENIIGELQDGHNAIKDQLILVLEIQMQAKKQSIKEEYEYFLAKGESGNELSEGDKEFVENFLEKEFEIDNHHVFEYSVDKIERMFLGIVENVKMEDVAYNITHKTGEIPTIKDMKRFIKKLYKKRLGSDGIMGINKKAPDNRGFIGLSFDGLHFHKKFELLDVELFIGDMPEDIEGISLQGTGFYHYRTTYIDVVKALPRGLLYLSIAGNVIDRWDLDSIRYMIQCLPPRLKNLDLGLLYLGERNSEEIVKMFSLLPQTIRSLGISNNDIGNISSVDIDEIAIALPRNLLKLDISRNLLGTWNPIILISFLASLPSHIYHLNLRENKLDKYSLFELKSIFAALGEKISHLDLSENNLYTYSKKDLDIPEDMVVLGLADSI